MNARGLVGEGMEALKMSQKLRMLCRELCMYNLVIWRCAGTGLRCHGDELLTFCLTWPCSAPLFQGTAVPNSNLACDTLELQLLHS